MNRVARAIRDGRAAHAAEGKRRLPFWLDLTYCVATGLMVIVWCFTMQDEERM